MAGCHIELWQIERRIRNVRCLKGATVTSISEYCHQIRTLELVNNLRFNFENDGMRSKCILIQPRFFLSFRFLNVLLFLALATIDGSSITLNDDESEYIQQHGVLAAAGELPGRNVRSVGRCVER